jgi:hypothetical protein
MAQVVAHFVFTLWGAGCLQRALREADRDDVVIATDHNLNFGPIYPCDQAARAKWLEEEFDGIDRKDAVWSGRVWHEARFPGHRKVAWLTRQSAMEYAGFLDWLWHRGDTPCDLVDLSEVKVSRPAKLEPPELTSLPVSLALLGPDIIAHNKLWELAKPLPMTERLRYRELWQQLIAEDAPLRVIEGDRLVSAPASFFDKLIMSYVTDSWRKTAKVLSEVATSHWDDNIWQTSDRFLQTRMRFLAKSGCVELRGEGGRDEFSYGEVRLARAA